MKMLRLLASFARARDGNVAVIFALATPLVIAAGALSVETSYWYHKQHQLQAAADNAAYAAGLENRNGSTWAAVQTAALNVATQNGFDSSAGTITVQTPTSGAHAGDPAAVQVILHQPAKRFFTQIFSSSPVNIAANAVSMYSNTANACILALDPSAAQAAYFSGSSSLTLNGCVVMSNSDAANGVYVWGAASLTATCVLSAGGVQQKGGIDDTGCSTPMTDVPPAPDPFKNLPAPASNGPCLTVPSGKGTINVPAGHYCSMDFKNGDYILAPGVYTVDGGFTANGNGAITGDGVTIYLKGSTGVSVNGNTTLNLSAPTSGTYSGILFFANRSVTSAPNSFNGTASSVMTGALYFPSQNVTYIGNFSGSNGCTQIVADTVAWSGNASFSENCSSYGMSPIPVMAAVKVVG